MIDLGYMAKRIVTKPDGFDAPNVQAIYAVSNCLSADFCDFVQHWQHNGYWFFDSPRLIAKVCQAEGLVISDFTLLYYAGHELQYDAMAKQWVAYTPDKDFKTAVVPPSSAEPLGFDIVTYSCQTQPECSPLSCNVMAEEVAVNEFCLLSSLDEAKALLEAGACDNAEPGPFRVVAIHEL